MIFDRPMRVAAKACRSLARLAHDRGGNVLLLLGLALIPMTFAVGFGIDYSRAMRLHTKLNAAADAAALAAVDATMMQQSDSAAVAAARNMFNAQVSGQPGLIYDPSNPNDLVIQIVSSGGVNTGRTVTVSYSAASKNVFGGILNSPSLPLRGSATSNAIRAPNINFYLAMDTSPSMLLPSTSNGLAAIRAATSTSHLPNGCAFACHTQNPHSDNIYIRNKSGQDIWLDSSGQAWPVVKVQNGYVYGTNANGQTVKVGRESSGQYADGYWLTRNYGALYGGSSIPLRIDDEQYAAQNLIPFAVDTAASNKVTYRMQYFTFDWTHPGDSSPVKAVTSSMTDVNNLTGYTVPNFYNGQDNWYRNNCPTSSLCNSDRGTEFYNTLARMNALMPNPGDGSSANSPQEVLFIVTDGMSDELVGGGRWHRELNSADLGLCTAIKNRGIRIAILYTEYLPESLTGDSWSQSNVAPYLPDVETALENCASKQSDGTPLFYKVSTDESISDALTALFSLTVQSARLLK